MQLLLKDLEWSEDAEFGNLFTHIQTPDGEWLEIWHYVNETDDSGLDYGVFMLRDDPEPGVAGDSDWIMAWRYHDALSCMCIVNGLLNPDTYNEVISHGTENKPSRASR